MNFQGFLKDYFIGQVPIIRQLNVLGGEIKQGKNLNIILAAQSGYGKTTLANAYIKWLDINYIRNSVYYNGRIDTIIPGKRFYVLDEAHLIDDPEFLYPAMDSGLSTFLILTNEYYSLKEPFYNRCHEFLFKDYTEEELYLICQKVLIEERIPLPRWCIEFIVKNIGRGVPRRLKILTRRLCYLFKESGIPRDRDSFAKEVEEFLNIKRGLTEFDIQYIDFLKQNQGRASLTLITNSTRIPKEVIIKEVEPYLVKRGMLTITSRGRQLTWEQK